MRPTVPIAGLLMLLALPAAAMAPSADDAKAALALSRAALGRQLDDFRFLDSERQPVALSDFRGKPLVINLVYTACVHTCPVIAETLHRHARAARDSLGADSFAIVSIGFDTANDTPERMRAFARQQGLDLDNWRFLSADTETMSRLTKALGFTLYPSAQGFDHLAQLTLLDGEGRVYRQIYGDYFEAPFLVEPLKDLVFGRRANLTSLDGLINRLKLFCTIYDPSAERYRFDYSVFIGVAMGLSVLAGLGTVLARALWREWRHRGTVAPTR
jgi:protein SCO1